ncbi:MAG: signal peptide peptidase SppA [Candidatus Diapherotrites archaeon]|nr:signal peptide peptidase SppA [Candidatus Diapherotrites archaeon]
MLRKKGLCDTHAGVYILAAIIAVIVLGAVAVMAALFMLGMADYGNVATVPLKGSIESESYESYFGFSVGARDVIKLIREADDDPMVSSILLDINSGGGSVVASKEIARAVREAEKPVVAYVGDVGASGAYYVAAAADEIVADEDSLTGSIGVIAQVDNYQGLMEKIGYNTTIIYEGEFKAMGSPFKELTDTEESMLRGIVQDAFQNFKRNVLLFREGRITAAALDSVADGRVINGRAALAVGLVDYVGSRDLALERCKALGGIEGEPVEREFVKHPSPFSEMFTVMGRAFAEGVFSSASERSGVRA